MTLSLKTISSFWVWHCVSSQSRSAQRLWEQVWRWQALAVCEMWVTGTEVIKAAAATCIFGYCERLFHPTAHDCGGGHKNNGDCCSPDGGRFQQMCLILLLGVRKVVQEKSLCRNCCSCWCCAEWGFRTDPGDNEESVLLSLLFWWLLELCGHGPANIARLTYFSWVALSYMTVELWLLETEYRARKISSWGSSAFLMILLLFIIPINFFSAVY